MKINTKKVKVRGEDDPLVNRHPQLVVEDRDPNLHHLRLLLEDRDPSLKSDPAGHGPNQERGITMQQQKFANLDLDLERQLRERAGREQNQHPP